MDGTGRVRSGKSSPETSDSPQNLLQMVVDESGGKFTPSKAGHSESTGTSNVLTSIHSLFKKKKKTGTVRVLTLSTFVKSAGQAKKTTLHLRACCKLKRARASEGTYALEMWASTIRTRGNSLW